MSPSPNVAIVSPMPSLRRNEGSLSRDGDKKEEVEDPLQGIAPMAPLGLYRGRNGAEKVRGRGEVGSMQTVNTALVTGNLFRSIPLSRPYSPAL